MVEPLLKLHRELTDNEKLNWTLKELHKLKYDYDKILSENNNLKSKVGKLLTKSRNDEIQYGSLNGLQQVSVKSYLKLRARYSEIEKKYWDNWNELSEIKCKLKK